MAKTAVVDFRLVGDQDVMMNPMSDGTRDDIEKGRTTPKSRMSARELAELKIIRDPDGRPAFRDDHLYECCVSAGRAVPWKGKQNITQSKPGIPSKVYSFLRLEQEWFPLSNGAPGEEPEWVVDKRPTPTQTGQRVMSIRPRFKRPWSIEGRMIIDTTDVSVAKVRELVETAGRLFGLGSYRGRFGLFHIDRWEVVKVEGDDEPGAEEKKGGKRAAKAAA